MEKKLSCDMRADCQAEVTHIDNKGYVYCTEHGVHRRSEPGLNALRVGVPQLAAARRALQKAGLL